MIDYDINFKKLSESILLASSKRELLKAVSLGLAKIASELKSDVIPKTPKETEELINSWREEEQSDDLLIVGFDIIYAAYQERGKRFYGTHIIVNRPAGGETGFMKNAIDENLERYYDLFAETVFDYIFG